MLITNKEGEQTMCLNMRANGKIMTMKKDRVVYKLLFVVPENLVTKETSDNQEYLTICKDMGMKRNKVYSANIKARKLSRYRRQITEGLHSIVDIRKEFLRFNYDIAVEAIIPAGAKYALGINNDIVSSELKLTGVVVAYQIPYDNRFKFKDIRTFIVGKSGKQDKRIML